MPDAAAGASPAALTTVLAGLGRIGVGYDLAAAGSQVLTHAKAITGDPRFSLVAAIDPDAAHRRRFEDAYGAPTYARLADVPRDLRADVAIVAAPTVVHEELVDGLAQHVAPRAILCEKPLADTLGAARRIVAACEARNVELFVNYIRRADPAVADVKRRIDAGLIRGPFRGLAWYSKGFLHNGSHFVDLLSHWIGPVTGGRRLNQGDPWGEHDRIADVALTFRDGEVLFAAAPAGGPNHHSIELIGSNGRLRYDRGGAVVEWQAAGDHAVLSGEATLLDTVERVPSGLDRYQARVLDHLVSALSGGPHALCTGRHALSLQHAMMTALDTSA